MLRIDVDAHIDESEATWEYLDDGARRFKPGEVQLAQDAVELLTARFDVRRAELDTMANEFVSPIDAKKNVLDYLERGRACGGP